MKEWTLEHPYLTFILLLLMIGSFNRTFNVLSVREKKPNEKKENESKPTINHPDSEHLN